MHVTYVLWPICTCVRSSVPWHGDSHRLTLQPARNTALLLVSESVQKYQRLPLDIAD